MFEFVRGNKRFAQIVLILVTLPFAFFGIESYISYMGSGDFVAAVGDHKISLQEFSRALRERQDRLRNQAGGKVDQALLESPELRASVLDALVKQRILAQQAAHAGLTVSDEQLQSAINAIPAFQQEGKFSLGFYKIFLRNQGMTEAVFESRLRQDLTLQQISDAYAEGAIVSNTVADNLIRISEQQREFSRALIPAERFVAQVRLDPAAVQAYYDAHQDEFRIPDQVRAEYVVLSADNMAAALQSGAEEAKNYYQEHLAQFQEAEERRARHILITALPDAPAQARDAARTKAEQLAKAAREAPAGFAELARSNSQDPGSAAEGGDLGFFARGAMVQQFEDAVFKMKTGEISGPVETPYGFHIIKLEAVKGGKVRPFEEVRAQVESELRKQQAGKKFAEAADNFGNLVYEQSDSLKPAADVLKLPLQQSGWLGRKGGGDAVLLNNEKVLQALFSDEVLKDKRNTEAIEVAPNTLVAARVLEYKPASMRAPAEANAEIARRLTLQQAGELARKEGMAALEKLRRGEAVTLAWGPAQTVSRGLYPNLSEGEAKEIFRTAAARFPAYAGAENPQGGFSLFRITRVADPAVSAEKRSARLKQLRQIAGEEEFSLYLASLKEKAKVEIKPENVEKK